MEVARLTGWSMAFSGAKFARGLMASMFCRFHACVQKLGGENSAKKTCLGLFGFYMEKNFFGMYSPIVTDLSHIGEAVSG